MSFFIPILLTYLYGSIPFSLLVGFLYKVDIRKEGSGNVGGSNLGRICGKRAFIYGFLLDFSKGVIAVLLASLFDISPLFLAVFALLGHTFSIFIKFKGGKGVATAFGFVVAYTFWGAMIAFSSFLIVLYFTKYVSLSSVLSILVYFIYTFFNPNLGFIYNTLILIILLLITYSHRDNMKRIKQKTERKITWM